MHKRLLYLLVLTSYFLLHSCASPQHKNESVSYTDDYGRTVQVPTPDAQLRVVSTSPAVTEIIFALGGQDLLVGRTDFCTYPPDALEIESIGGISNLNVEKIVSLDPDIVISGSMIPKKSTDQLEKMGVATVHVIEKQRFDGLYENISRIGQLIGRTPQADSLNEVLRERISQLSILDSQNSSPKLGEVPEGRRSVYYVVGFGPTGNFTAGGDSFINDIITMAGGHNVAEDITGWSYSLEALLTADPDYILIRREDSAAFCTTAPYTRLSAVKQHRVIGINSGLIDLQVPRNIDAVQFLAHRLSRTE